MRRGFGPLVLFVFAYMVVFGAMAWRARNAEFIMYSAAMVVIILLVLWIHTRVRFTLPLLWLLAIWGFLHMAGGNVPVNGSVLYSYRPFAALPRYDQCVHAFGFFCATLASWQALRVASRGQLRATLGPVFAAVLCGLGLGAVNEVLEFAATQLLPHTNVGGYVNTGWDLVSNTVGAVLAGLFILVRGK